MRVGKERIEEGKKANTNATEDVQQQSVEKFKVSERVQLHMFTQLYLQIIVCSCRYLRHTPGVNSNTLCSNDSMRGIPCTSPLSIPPMSGPSHQHLL